ncbi:MAG: 2-amino-4-hydroxy-6-hydroxymethyldihydropteridine diphosphokinase [Candidatus Margulisiibacteriota bacterium]
MNQVYISLGSNLGPREKNIEQALDLLSQHSDISVQQISTLYETVAVASYKQPNFLNGAAKLSTILTPYELLTVTESIENQLGRSSKGTGDPRPIDIDILFYNSEIISMDHLTIPHPMAHERLFVLDPLYEIAPNFEHPILNESIRSLREALRGY